MYRTKNDNKSYKGKDQVTKKADLLEQHPTLKGKSLKVRRA